MTDADPRWKALRSQFLKRSIVMTLAAVPAGVYVLILVLGLTSEQAQRTIPIALPPALLVSVGFFQFWVAGWLCRQALATNPNERPGARLERLMALPRTLELWSMTPAYTLAGLLYTLGIALREGTPASSVAIGAGVALAFALLVGIPTTLLFQDDTLPYVLEEQQKHPRVRPQIVGATWPRQSWYLPYSFSVLLLLLFVYCGGVAALKLQEELVAQLSGVVADPQRVQAMVVTALWKSAAPVFFVSAVLLGIFLYSGWLMGRRERKAAQAIEQSLLQLVAGTPVLPAWVGTDEVGDVAFAVALVSSDMKKIFAQLQAMAEGNLSVQLSGESGLVAAFRASQASLKQLSEEMNVLARGDTANGARLAGDLGIAFGQLSAALGATISQAKTIAQGDLRKDIQVSGELGAAIHQMTKNLRGMVGQTQETGAKIADIVVSLRSSSAQLSTATTEQVSALTETANTMTEMSQTSAASADRCAELIKQGESASAVVENGRSSAKEAERAIGAIAQALSKVLAVSGALAEKVKQVDNIIETVGFLADQSSTLAINAGIEASRAGEAGRGFAAVAREMRTLASDSRKATGQIREILQEIRQKTVQVDASVAAGSSTVDDGVRLVNQLGDAIGVLGVTIHDAVGLMRQVEGSARQHQAGVAQVTQALRSMQGASESIRDGARLLSGLSQQAHDLSSQLKLTSQSYQLPARVEATA